MSLTSAERQKAWRESRRQEAVSLKRKKQNVLVRARQAARNGLPYQTKSPMFGDVAAAAYAAEEQSRKATERADKAHERAVSAHAAADSANEAADKAKEDAADARAMAIENNKLITCLAGEVGATSTPARTTENRLTRVEQRLNSQMTPEQRMGYMTGLVYDTRALNVKK